MGWFARIFANALARRLAAVIVAGALAWLGMGAASAQDYTKCFDENANGDLTYICPTQADAYQMVKKVATKKATEWQEPIVHAPSQRSYAITYRGMFGNAKAIRYYPATNPCGVGKEFNSFTGECQQSCTGRQSQTTSFMPATGSTQCFNGCVATYSQNADDTSIRSFSGSMCGNEDFRKNCPVGSFYNGYMGVCEPLAKQCPPGQESIKGYCQPTNQCPEGMVSVTGSTPGAIQQGALYCKPAENECPPGTIKSPLGQCLPGEGQCAAGEALRENGTCGKDSDGDGKADDDDDDPSNDSDKPSASGGESCDAPPSCSGNAIDCMQVKIQWRIDCNTRSRANIAGGACNSMPVCTGDGCKAAEHAQLIMQWRTACAVEKLAAKGEGAGSGDDGLKEHMTALKQAEVNGLRGLGQDDGHGDVDPDGIWAKDSDYGDGKLDKGLFGGGGGTCDLSFTIGGQVVSPPAQFWRIVSIIHWLLIAAAYLWVASKLG